MSEIICSIGADVIRKCGLGSFMLSRHFIFQILISRRLLNNYIETRWPLAEWGLDQLSHLGGNRWCHADVIQNKLALQDSDTLVSTAEYSTGGFTSGRANVRTADRLSFGSCSLLGAQISLLLNPNSNFSFVLIWQLNTCRTIWLCRAELIPSWLIKSINLRLHNRASECDIHPFLADTITNTCASLILFQIGKFLSACHPSPYFCWNTYTTQILR